MLKTVNILGVVIGALMVIFALSRFTPVYFALFGVLLIFVSYACYWITSRKKKKQHIADMQARIEVLTFASWHAGKTLKIYKRKWLYVLSVSILCSGLWGVFAQCSTKEIDWLLLLFAVVMVLLSGLFIIYTPITKPQIVLSKDGFSYYPYSFIAWADISKLAFSEQRIKGQKIIRLHIKLSGYDNRMTWREYLVNARTLKKGSATLNLNHFTEQPDVIAAVTEFLWKDANSNLQN